MLDWLVAIGAIGAVVVGFLAWRWPRAPNSDVQFSVVGHEWVEDVRGYAYVRLLQELVGLDYASMPDLLQETEGYPAQWAPIFQKSRETWRLVINRDHMIVAYWAFFFPTDELIEKIRSGAFLEGALTADEVLSPKEPTQRPIFLSMLVKHPVLERSAEVAALLFESIVQAVDDLEKRSIRPTQIFSTAYAPAGYSTSESLGLEKAFIDQRGHTVFVGEWGPKLRSRLLERASKAWALERGSRRQKSISP